MKENRATFESASAVFSLGGNLAVQISQFEFMVLGRTSARRLFSQCGDGRVGCVNQAILAQRDGERGYELTWAKLLLYSSLTPSLTLTVWHIIPLNL